MLSPKTKRVSGISEGMGVYSKATKGVTAMPVTPAFESGGRESEVQDSLNFLRGGSHRGVNKADLTHGGPNTIRCLGFLFVL